MMGKKIVLINPPWLFKEEVEFVSQNLGLGYLASYLQAQGHEIIFIDALLEGINQSVSLFTKYAEVLKWGLSDEKIISRIPSDADIIGITAPFTDSRFTVNSLCRLIKSVFPETILVMGGVYPSTLPKEALVNSHCDIAVIGEGEIPLSQIAAGKNWNQINGICFVYKNSFIKTPLGEMIKDLNELPMPSFDIRPMDKYVQWSPRGNKADKTLSLVSSRGCPNHCRFCSIKNVYGRRWRAFSAERVLGEIQFAIEHFKINYLEFEDDNLTLQKNRAADIFRGIIELRKKSDLKWSAPNGVMLRSLDRELIGLMKESGCEMIYLPVESGDEMILEKMNKVGWKDHLKKSLEVASYCNEASIQTSAFVIVGYPGEDRASFERTVEYCKRLQDIGVTGITPLVATPYPGTDLYEECKKNGWLVYSDMREVLIYQRYSEFLPEFVLIQTPWCSRQEVYERHKEMMELFPTYHNVRKENEKILSGAELIKETA